MREHHREAVYAGFEIPDHVLAGILDLSMPDEYHACIKNIPLDQLTFDEAATHLRNEHRSHLTKVESKAITLATTSDAALVSKFGSNFCVNCKKSGHVSANCWAADGGKEGQAPKKKKKKWKREKANTAQESDKADESMYIRLD